MFGTKTTKAPTAAQETKEEAEATETPVASKKPKATRAPSPRNRHLITMDVARRTARRLEEDSTDEAGVYGYWFDLQPMELWRAARKEVMEGLEPVDGQSAVADLARWMGRNRGHPAIQAFAYVPYPVVGDRRAKLAVSRMNRAIQKARYPEMARILDNYAGGE